MSTVPIFCPKCRSYLRVAVQPSVVVINNNQLYVEFHSQVAAHTCEEEPDAKGS